MALASKIVCHRNIRDHEWNEAPFAVRSDHEAIYLAIINQVARSDCLSLFQNDRKLAMKLCLRFVEDEERNFSFDGRIPFEMREDPEFYRSIRRYSSFARVRDVLDSAASRCPIVLEDTKFWLAIANVANPSDDNYIAFHLTLLRSLHNLYDLEWAPVSVWKNRTFAQEALSNPRLVRVAVKHMPFECQVLHKDLLPSHFERLASNHQERHPKHECPIPACSWIHTLWRKV